MKNLIFHAARLMLIQIKSCNLIICNKIFSTYGAQTQHQALNKNNPKKEKKYFVLYK